VGKKNLGHSVHMYCISCIVVCLLLSFKLTKHERGPVRLEIRGSSANGRRAQWSVQDCLEIRRATVKLNNF